MCVCYRVYCVRSAVRPSRLLAAKDDCDQFVKVSDISRREVPVTSRRQQVQSADEEDTDEADDDKVTF